MDFSEVPQNFAKPSTLRKKVYLCSFMLVLPGSESASYWFDSELEKTLECVVETRELLNLFLRFLESSLILKESIIISKVMERHVGKA